MLKSLVKIFSYIIVEFVFSDKLVQLIPNTDEQVTLLQQMQTTENVRLTQKHRFLLNYLRKVLPYLQCLQWDVLNKLPMSQYHNHVIKRNINTGIGQFLFSNF